MRTILTNSYDNYQKLYEQIDWIISTSSTDSDSIFTNRDEAAETIGALLVIIPKRREALGVISSPKEKEKERHRLISALQQALESAKKFKLTKNIKALEKELAALEEESE